MNHLDSLVTLVLLLGRITSSMGLVNPKPTRPFSSLTLKSQPDNTPFLENDQAKTPPESSVQELKEVDETTENLVAELDSELLEEVRLELVQKYLEQGVSEEVAEKEVDIFLADSQRSQQYIEMRQYAQAQADDLGVGFGLQLFGGFLFGFLGIAGPKYYQAFQAASSSGDLQPPVF